MLLLLALGSAGAGFSQVAAVIVNAEMSFDNLPFEKLKRIYKGKLSNLGGGDRVAVLILPPTDTAVRRVVLEAIYESPDERFYLRTWQSEPRSPEPTAHPWREAILEVREGRRTFAIVDASAVDAAKDGEPALLDGVKILALDDLQPTDPGYPLRAKTQTKR